MSSLAVFGGTFNPIHLGHVRLAKEAARQLSLERVILMPTWTPPHKEAPDLALAEHRLAMCRLAAQGQPLLEVSDLELRRGGRSYTIDTVEELQRLYPRQDITLLVGGDMLRTFEQWRRWQDILDKVILCAAPRLPQERPALEALAREYRAKGWRCQVLELPAMVVSSTDIRRRFALGEEISSLVGPEVAAYMEDHQLYCGKGESHDD